MFKSCLGFIQSRQISFFRLLLRDPRDRGMHDYLNSRCYHLETLAEACTSGSGEVMHWEKSACVSRVLSSISCFSALIMR
mmetsp:Transcript_89925/g.142069  ORF Transcript_89925/g.142069 Transcript_89925/m.142069 type:complete len:80 (-) Transcript_89925:18-257(-)